ncbi:hypothetical protein [Natranaerofaba carboxydovora]|uniref:hypothetical protein n=1 Tax=Natranaerofaba carboxydovora TaxID=2742683 RepID=UPI001F1345DA|nr:hypothetical protein [Natranaerofaba carboxydovora]UMZ73745.1 hypothetical protein ACONDI_01313 [Natranaerofaba carboxydovora]
MRDEKDSKLTDNIDNKIGGEHYWSVLVKFLGHPDQRLYDYFGDLTFDLKQDGSTLLSGELSDLPAVYGLILKLRDLGLGVQFIKVEKVGKKQ